MNELLSDPSVLKGCLPHIAEFRQRGDSTVTRGFGVDTVTSKNPNSHIIGKYILTDFFELDTALILK